MPAQMEVDFPARSDPTVDLAPILFRDVLPDRSEIESAAREAFGVIRAGMRARDPADRRRADHKTRLAAVRELRGMLELACERERPAERGEAGRAPGMYYLEEIERRRRMVVGKRGEDEST
jgi:hypothetical protein